MIKMRVMIKGCYGKLGIADEESIVKARAIS